MNETRQIVVPGELLGRTEDVQPGQNTYVESGNVFALRLGVKSVRGDRVNVIGLSGRYEPFRGDMVIGTIAEVGPSNWYINIGAANDVGMHVNDVPWRVEFGETSKYLAVGDTVLLKIVHVDEMKKAQVSMKDRQCRKLTGGLIFEVAPSKVPRIVGRQGSMITMLKDATNVRIFVGQNGKIWLDGEPEDVALALEALRKIEAEAHTSGLTDRMKAWLEERRPSAQRTHKQSSEMEAEAEEDREITRERRERPERPERRERPRRFEEESAEREERPARRPRFEEEPSPRRGRPESEKHRYQRAEEDDTSDADMEERRGREREHPKPHHSERRAGGERHHHEERRREDRSRDERPRPRRFEDEEERPARKPRFEEAEEEPAPRRRPNSDEPAGSSSRQRRGAFDDEEEERSRPKPRRAFEDEEQPMRRPSRRFEDEEPRPAARRSVRDEEPEAPRRRASFDDEEDKEDRPSRRDDRGSSDGGRRQGSDRAGGFGRGGGRGHRGGRGRGGRGQE